MEWCPSTEVTVIEGFFTQLFVVGSVELSYKAETKWLIIWESHKSVGKIQLRVYDVWFILYNKDNFPPPFFFFQVLIVDFALNSLFIYYLFFFFS